MSSDEVKETIYRLKSRQEVLSSLTEEEQESVTLDSLLGESETKLRHLTVKLQGKGVYKNTENGRIERSRDVREFVRHTRLQRYLRFYKDTHAEDDDRL